MGHLHQTNKNIRSTQPTLDKTRYKECEPSTHESLHISKIWKTQLIFAALEKWYASTLTKQVSYLLLQARETITYASFMTLVRKK